MRYILGTISNLFLLNVLDEYHHQIRIAQLPQPPHNANKNTFWQIPKQISRSNIMCNDYIITRSSSAIRMSRLSVPNATQIDYIIPKFVWFFFC